MLSAQALQQPPRHAAGDEQRPAGWASEPDGLAELCYPPGALVVVGGIPGAGKTTLLRRLFGAAGPATVLDSEDVAAVARRLLRTRRGYALYRPLVHLAHWVRVRRALRGHGPVVVHETATRRSSRRRLARWARARRRSAHLLLLDVPARAAREGQRARGRRVTGASMRRHVRRFDAIRRRPSGVAEEGYASVIMLTRADAARLHAVRFAAPQPGGSMRTMRSSPSRGLPRPSSLLVSA